MDVGTSAFTLGRHGNKSELLSQNASSSLSGGIPHQTEENSMMPSFITFDSGTKNDTERSLPFSSFSVPDGFSPAEPCWTLPLTRNTSYANEGGAINPGNSLLFQREMQMQMQHVRCQDGRFLQNGNREEFSGFSHVQMSGGFGGLPHHPDLDFSNNLAVHDMPMISSTYGNSNISASGFTHAFDGNYNAINTHSPYPAYFHNSSSFHSTERPPQINEVCIQQNLRLQTQPKGIFHRISEETQQLNGPNGSYHPQSYQRVVTNGFLPTQEREVLTPTINPAPNGPQTSVAKLDHNDQRQLLLLYYHARICPGQAACAKTSCMKMKMIIHHMKFCQKSCLTCIQLESLLDHHRCCNEADCPVCAPVRKLLFKVSLANPRSELSDRNADIPEPSSKRSKGECSHSENLPQKETLQASETVDTYCEMSPGEQLSGQSCKTTITGSAGEMKSYDYSFQGSPIAGCEVKLEDSGITDEEIPVNSMMITGLKPCGNSPRLEIVEVSTRTELSECGKVDQKICNCDESETREKAEACLPPADDAVKSECRRQNIKGVSLVESFTLEQVLTHIRSLKDWVGLGKAKAAKNQALENLDDKNSCQLCGMGALSFEPPPIYCVKCYGRIKHNRAYHTMANCDGLKNGGAGRIYLCNPCFNGSHGDSVTYIGGVLSKVKLEKKRNDLEVIEQWVECDKCKGWQHQICALFNAKRNVEGQAGYTCPKCHVEEMERGECEPLPVGIILGARDLRRSKLSDHIEQRLALSLARERRERADSAQKIIDEVPSAENLIVRVVSSVDKKLEVKQLFRQTFEGKGYPAEFPYKSKAILLFQEIEGADVCLFAMYVQEYGSACSQPNQRRVCLSYLDSVKYFRPDVKCVSGEALRTFVYLEILIGYLDYCKLRGFTSCHIWSCPPLKQEDFILNCHPEIQKTPKPEKLREWYMAMIRKATKEKIVAENTRLFDFFFVPSEDGRENLTAARLPYFDGDYWPGCAEDVLQSLQQIEDGKEPEKKGKMTITKRALKAARHGSSSLSPSKDSLLMFKLGEVIRPMRDDLIVIHLQHACCHCRDMIVSGKIWVCDQCKKFQLCDACYVADQSRVENSRHPVKGSDKHSFHSLEVDAVATDTADEDANLQSEFFDSRLAFLNLCQGNHYQYDTLRRAKHSTMMILYHLHNPSVSAFVASCFHCHVDIEPGHGWRCDTCPDYDVCASCYSEHGRSGHAHELVRHAAPSRGAVPAKARSRIQSVLELLVHASKCRTMRCEYPSCRNVKGLFHHGASCRIRLAGGCNACKKMWYILRLHARACKEGDECCVPRCRDLKEHMRKMESQSDSRRRFAAMARMRQLEQTDGGGEKVTGRRS